MKYRNVVTGEVFEAEFRTDHAASSYGQPVLVRTDTGKAVDGWYLEPVRGKPGKRPCSAKS